MTEPFQLPAPHLTSCEPVSNHPDAREGELAFNFLIQSQDRSPFRRVNAIYDRSGTPRVIIEICTFPWDATAMVVAGAGFHLPPESAGILSRATAAAGSTNPDDVVAENRPLTVQEVEQGRRLAAFLWHLRSSAS